MDKNEPALSKQLCFLFYVSSKEIIKKYSIYLKDYSLTYTGYIVLMNIKQDEIINIKTLGSRVFLDSGTLTPLLKKLEKQGFVKRTRAINDERNLEISLTAEGQQLKENVSVIPEQVFNNFDLSTKEGEDLKIALENFVSKNFEVEKN